MDALKVSAGSREVLAFINDKLPHYDPMEKAAALKVAAATIETTLQEAAMSAMLQKMLGDIFGGKGSGV